MPMTALEAVDLIRFADVFADRLAQANAELSRKRGHEREKAWLQTAADLVDEARRPCAGLVDRARTLPELADLREEFAVSLLNGWVDALEKLLAGITFHVSGRSPIIEALFPHQKFPVLRKGARDAAEKFHKDFEKRLKTGYVTRMLATDDFAFAQPVLEALRKAWAEYQSCFDGSGAGPEESAALRAELAEAGERIELAVRQGRLLAEAALLPVAGAFETSQLGQKPKRRAGKAAPELAVESAAVAADADAVAQEVATGDAGDEGEEASAATAQDEKRDEQVADDSSDDAASAHPGAAPQDRATQGVQPAEKKPRKKKSASGKPDSSELPQT